MFLEILILMFLSIYFFIGFSQIILAQRIKREAKNRKFKEKDAFVSVIIPIRERTITTYCNLESVCRQEYPKYEVIFISESAHHPAYEVAKILQKRHPNAKVLLSGRHNPKKNIAKCHNLIYGEKHAKGEILLFGDSDVNYPEDWILKMTGPLGEIVNGKKIDATTSPFFIEPESSFGKFIANSISSVTFTTSFTKEEFKFPPYASGASIAIQKDMFRELGIAIIWENSYNDDLVFAKAVLDSGHHIYNQLAHLNHPNEAFSSLKQSKDKLIRWVVTISTFGHGNLNEHVPYMLFKNLQFQASLILGIFVFLGFSWILGLGIISAGYIYSVIYRWKVGQIIEEKGMTSYYLLAPVSTTTMMMFYLYVRLFYRTFYWGEDAYSVL
jgi:glycosyltransferase involved in cell wall biosynthesis